jgi:hypothetical protein
MIQIILALMAFVTVGAFVLATFATLRMLHWKRRATELYGALDGCNRDLLASRMVVQHLERNANAGDFMSVLRNQAVRMARGDSA